MNLSPLFQVALEKILGLRKRDRYRPPVVTILNPESAAIEADSEPIRIDGHFESSQATIIRISWNNYHTGEHGDAVITEEELFNIQNIKLNEGENLISVTATDYIGQVGSDSVIVVYTPPPE